MDHKCRLPRIPTHNPYHDRSAFKWWRCPTCQTLWYANKIHYRRWRTNDLRRN